MILEEARARGEEARIAVAQPRRVAALGLARRVAEELGEPGPGGVVGYRVGGESRPGRAIDFCTTGYLLQLLVNAPQELARYTHVVLDEVHERSADSDMLCLVVRLLVSGPRKGTRVVVMSATLQTELFLDYFAQLAGGARPASVSVATRCFPIAEHFLEELPAALGLRQAQEVARRARELFPEARGPEWIDTRHVEKLHAVILELLQLVTLPGCTTLVFLPGVAEISALWQELRRLEDGAGLQVLPLHSLLPREEQEQVLCKPEPQVRRVVLATDIAESSLTLPEVVAVVDLGLHRRVDHGDRRAMSCLTTKWISRAAAVQRSGRAGRTRPGTCIRLYTRRFFQSHMAAHAAAESGSMPLDRLYLQAKQLSQQLRASVGGSAPQSAQEVLLGLVQAPTLGGIEAARAELAELGAIAAPAESAKITRFGQLCLQLPIDMRLSRVVWLGALWGATADAVVLASALSSLEPFLAPSAHFVRDEEDFTRMLRESTSMRLLFDGGAESEPLMLRQVFLEWLLQFHESGQLWGFQDGLLRARRRHTELFSKRFALARGRMEHLVSQVLDVSLRSLRACRAGSRADQQLRALIASLGYSVNARGDLSAIRERRPAPLDPRGIFEENTALLKALLAAAFSDLLLVGSYWGARQAPEGQRPAKAAAFKNAWLLEAVARAGVAPERAALFAARGGGPLPGIEAYVDTVCGRSLARPQLPLEDHDVVLVELQADGEAPGLRLSSRSEPLPGDCPALRWELNLLHHFGLAMREVHRADATRQWAQAVHLLQHPCSLQWELMCPMASFKGRGKGTGKGKPMRCSALLERRNALGLAARVPSAGRGAEGGMPARLSRTAVFAVAASAQGSESPGRAYPSGVTLLPAAHLGFALLTAKAGAAEGGLRRFGLTPLGSLAILGRCVDLPCGCLGEAWWEQVRQLRAALRQELSAPAAEAGAALLADAAGVQEAVWQLLTLGLDFAGQDATESTADPWQAADVLAAGPSGTLTALQPLATWQELHRRRALLQPAEDPGPCSEDAASELEAEEEPCG